MRNAVLMAATALVILGAAALPAKAKDWKTVTVATEAAYEPWNLTKPDGSFDGYEPELLRNLCARMKLECKMVAQDFDGMIPALQAGKVDVIMDALSITDDRKKVIGFTIPYLATFSAFAADKTGPLANAPGTGTSVKLANDGLTPSLESLRTAFKGKTIGVQSATVFLPFVVHNFKDVATIREYKLSPERDIDLTTGRIDLAFDDVGYFTAAFTKPDNKDLAYTGPQIGGAVWGPGQGFGMRQSDQDLIALFDGALTEAIKDGTVKALSLKWFKTDLTP